MATILVFNGASSSGKSTFIKELIPELDSPFFYYSSDMLVEAGMLPEVDRKSQNQSFSWNVIRPRFFDGFHRSIKAFANGGNNLIVEHVVEFPEWYLLLKDLLREHRVFYIGVFCPIEILREREKSRGNRFIGEGESHLDDGIHSWCFYDLKIDTHIISSKENIRKVKALLASHG